MIRLNINNGEYHEDKLIVVLVLKTDQFYKTAVISTGTSISYTLKQWPKLMDFMMKDGRIEIDR